MSTASARRDKERLILVDLGVTFPDMDSTPGVDLIFPDISWLIERRDRLEAVFVTHAHEDHVGAVSQFYGQLGVPVHARAFTANIARGKMEERGHPPEAVRTAPLGPKRLRRGRSPWGSCRSRIRFPKAPGW